MPLVIAIHSYLQNSSLTIKSINAIENVVRQISRVPIEDDDALCESNDAVAELPRKFNLMNVDHCEHAVFTSDARKVTQHSRSKFRIEACDRFIGQQNARLLCHCARNGCALFLTA